MSFEYFPPTAKRVFSHSIDFGSKAGSGGGCGGGSGAALQEVLEHVPGHVPEEVLEHVPEEAVEEVPEEDLEEFFLEEVLAQVAEQVLKDGRLWRSFGGVSGFSCSACDCSIGTNSDAVGSHPVPMGSGGWHPLRLQPSIPIV